jgi:hypothetical protein
MDETGEKTPKRMRKPKTKKQRAGAALASQRHRTKKTAAGIPTGPQIDTALAAFLVQGIGSSKGLHLDSRYRPALITRVIRWARWNAEESRVQAAVADRFDFLTARQWPGRTGAPASEVPSSA